MTVWSRLPYRTIRWIRQKIAVEVRRYFKRSIFKWKRGVGHCDSEESLLSCWLARSGIFWTYCLKQSSYHSATWLLGCAGDACTKVTPWQSQSPNAQPLRKRGKEPLSNRWLSYITGRMNRSIRLWSVCYMVTAFATSFKLFMGPTFETPNKKKCYELREWPNI